MKLLHAAALAVLGLGFAETPAQAEGWDLQIDERGSARALALWARPVPGSHYPEYRMEVSLAAAPDEVIGALESNLVDPRTWPRHFEREVLHRENGLMLSYDYIRVPLLADRDVVLRTEMGREDEGGAYRMQWSATRTEELPEKSGVVRMPRSEGFWLVEPDGQGGSRAVYQSFVEFTGRIPSTLVDSNMARSIVTQAEWLRRVLHERRLVRSR